MPKHLVNAAARLGAILLALLACSPAWAAVANQACTPTVGSTTGQHFNASTSFSFTNVTVASGSNLALTLIVQFDVGNGTTPATVSSAVWDQAGANQSLAQTNAGPITGGLTGANIETWTLINPTPGPNKTITITISSSQPVFVSACAWTGVDQTGGGTSFPHTANATAAATVNVTSAAGNAVVAAGSAGVAITGFTGTLIYSDSLNGTNINAFSNFDAGSASVVIGDSSILSAISATDIKAASGGGGGCTSHHLGLLGAGC